MKDKIIIQFEKAEPEKITINETIRLVVSGGVELRLDKKSGVLSLHDKKGTLLSEVDFPTEKIITNAYYDDTTKELVIDFENANQVRIPIKADVSGLEETIIKVQETADEAKKIAEGRARSKVFETFDDMQTYLKNANNSELKIGDNLYIKALNVPDYWVSTILDNNIGTYGYYQVAQLETQKVDLSNIYTIPQTDELLNKKANASDLIVSETEMNALIEEVYA